MKYKYICSEKYGAKSVKSFPPLMCIHYFVFKLYLKLNIANYRPPHDDLYSESVVRLDIFIPKTVFSAGHSLIRPLNIFPTLEMKVAPALL